MSQVEQLLRQKLGLDADSIGSTLIQRTVRLRMKSLGLKNADEYVTLLQKSNPEWNELVESVVVTDTWFFRDEHPFASLARLVIDEWLPNHPTGVLRLLSVPCSSGEEPYSLVMALRDAGLPLQRLHVDAVDVSLRALARARIAVYGRNSFRTRGLAFRDRYFRQTKEGYVLAPVIRQAVNFHRGNLLAPNFPAGKASYDIIFCRNLLIYFDPPTQRKALSKIAGLLNPTGVVFVGAAEQPLAIAYGFTSARLPMAFACRKPAGALEIAPARERRLTKLSRPLLPPRSDTDGATGSAPSVAARPTCPRPADDGDERGVASLEPARRLADAGRLKEAAELCETFLRDQGPSAQAFYLLGLVLDAAGQSGALDYYRKALYLEPNHYEALMQMALWSQKCGNSARARTFRLRAQRAREANPKAQLR
jgi:chemotaxis protein methyltransferase WspC